MALQIYVMLATVLKYFEETLDKVVEPVRLRWVSEDRWSEEVYGRLHEGEDQGGADVQDGDLSVRAGEESNWMNKISNK